MKMVHYAVKENGPLCSQWKWSIMQPMKMVHFYSFWKKGGGQGIFFVFFPCSQFVPIMFPKCPQIRFPRCPTLLKRLQMILPGRKVNFDSQENGNEGSWTTKKYFIFIVWPKLQGGWGLLGSAWKINKKFNRRLQSIHKTNGKKKVKKSTQRFFVFFSPGTKGPRVYKEKRFQGDWEHKCCGH